MKAFFHVLMGIWLWALFACQEKDRLQIAQKALDVGDHQRARKVFNELLDQNPASVEARYGLALSWFREGQQKLDDGQKPLLNWQEAQKEFQILSQTDSTLKINEWHSLCLFYLAKEFLKEDAEESLVALEKALLLDSNNTLAMNLKALILNEIGAYEEAETLWREILAINPQFELAWVYLGNLAWEKGDFAEAYIQWQLGLEQNPSSKQLQEWVKQVERKLGI